MLYREFFPCRQCFWAGWGLDGVLYAGFLGFYSCCARCCIPFAKGCALPEGRRMLCLGYHECLYDASGACWLTVVCTGFDILEHLPGSIWCVTQPTLDAFFQGLRSTVSRGCARGDNNCLQQIGQPTDQLTESALEACRSVNAFSPVHTFRLPWTASHPESGMGIHMCDKQLTIMTPCAI